MSTNKLLQKFLDNPNHIDQLSIVTGRYWGKAVRKVSLLQPINPDFDNIPGMEDYMERTESLMFLQFNLTGLVFKKSFDEYNTAIQAKINRINDEIYRITEQIETTADEKEGADSINKRVIKRTMKHKSQIESLKMLRHILSHTANNRSLEQLNLFFASAKNLIAKIDVLEYYVTSMDMRNPKRTIGVKLVRALRSKLNNHIETVLDNSDPKNRTISIMQRSKKFKAECSQLILRAEKNLGEHRDHDWVRKTGNITLAVFTVCTAGLALAVKGLFSYFKDGKATFFAKEKTKTTQMTAGISQKLQFL